MASGLIDEGILSLIGIVGLVTISGSVYMILHNHPLYAWLYRRGWLRMFGSGRAEVEEERGPKFRNHVIVVGMNALGTRIVRDLMAAGEAVVAIDSDPTKLRGLGCPAVVGSTEHLSVLEQANLAEARLLVSALQIEDENNLLAFRGKEAGVPTAIHAFDRLVVGELREIGADHLIMSKNAGTRRLAAAFMEIGRDEA